MSRPVFQERTPYGDESHSRYQGMMCLANDILIQNARRMEHPASFDILQSHKPERVDEKRRDHDCGNEWPGAGPGISGFVRISPLKAFSIRSVHRSTMTRNWTMPQQSLIPRDNNGSPAERVTIYETARSRPEATGTASCGAKAEAAGGASA